MLTKKDRLYFNEVMVEAEKSIKVIDKQVNKEEELKELMGVVWEKEIHKELLQGIKDEPERMIEQSGFINKYLPELEYITEMYVKVKEKGVTSEEDSVIENTKESVKVLSKSIEDSYKDFYKPYVDELDVEKDRVLSMLKRREERNNI